MSKPAGFLSDEDYNFIFNRVVRFCVDMVILDDSGKILMTRRGIPPYQNLWHLPGGAVRHKETIESAVNRIAKKEFAVQVKIKRFLGVCETLNDDLGPTQPRHSNSVVVEVEIIAGTPSTSTETNEVAYFDTTPRDIHPYHGPCLEELGLLKPVT